MVDAQTAGVEMQPSATSEIESLKILFIGNSFTARNNMPGLLSELATSCDRRLDYRLISAGGASLRRHLNAGAALPAIQDGRYDYVVLQEQSTLPVKNPKRMHENIRLFDQAIRAAGSRTALYLTWARKNAPEKQQSITDAYTSIAEELGAERVPVGVAWETFLAKHDQPALYAPDGSHPTLAGSYLAACVFLAVLFRQNPVNLVASVEGLAPGDARLLRSAAGSIMKRRSS